MERFVQKLTFRQISNRITNELIGLVLPLGVNGLPTTHVCEATFAENIDKFVSEGTRAKIVYVFMAKPLQEGASPFCLGFFGTGNKFSSHDVKKRWTLIEEEAGKYGVTVLGFSSDGDPKLLRAMCEKTFHSPLVDGSAWSPILVCPSICPEDITTSGSSETTCIQDPTHTATKQRNRLFATAGLSMGDFFVCHGHLKILYKMCPNRSTDCQTPM